MKEKTAGHHDPYFTLLRDWINKYNGINKYNKRWRAKGNFIVVAKGSKSPVTNDGVFTYCHHESHPRESIKTNSCQKNMITPLSLIYRTSRWKEWRSSLQPVLRKASATKYDLKNEHKLAGKWALSQRLNTVCESINKEEQKINMNIKRRWKNIRGMDWVWGGEERKTRNLL